MKKKLLSVLCLLALVSSSGCGVKAFKSKKFWAETAVISGAATYDGITTNNLLKRCPTECYETNPLLGQRPSTPKIFLTGLAFHGLKRLVIALVWQADPELGTRLSTADAVVSTTYHVTFGIHNSKMCPRGEFPAGGGCRP